MPIGEVGVRAGFADQCHPTRWFTRYFAITPGTYRLATPQPMKPAKETAETTETTARATRVVAGRATA